MTLTHFKVKGYYFKQTISNRSASLKRRLLCFPGTEWKRPQGQCTEVHSCSTGNRATSGAGSRNWPRKHCPFSTHFKGIKDARLRESSKVAEATHCVSGFGETLENHWVGQLPKEQTDVSFQNTSVDQPIICNKKECSALGVKNPAFKVLCGADHTAHVLFERFFSG